MRRSAAVAAVTLLLAMGARGPCPAAAAAAPEPRPTRAAAGSPVVLDGEVLFSVRERVLSFAPEDRARIISERIAKLARDPAFRVESLGISDGETTTDVVAGDRVIMSVTDRDATAEGRPRRDVAEAYARRIRDVLSERSRAYGFRSLALGVLYTVLATAALAAIIVGIRRLSARLLGRVDTWRGTRIRSLKFQRVEIIGAGRLTDIVRGAVRAARLLAIVAVLYFYVPLALSFFPWTRGVSAKLLHYIVDPFAAVGRGVLGYLPNLFFVAVIVVLTHYANRFIRYVFNEVKAGTIAFPGFYPEWADPTFKIVRFLVIAFAAVVAFPYLPGSESPAFKGVSIFLGVLLSLGSTSAVANVVAGVIITYMRAFRVGDRVKIADTVGDVTEMTLLVARIRTIKNVDVTIPNSMILGSHIVNYSSSASDKGLVLNTTVTIGYDTPWRTVHDLLDAAARATENVLENPPPFVFQTALNDFYVTYELNAFTREPRRMAEIYSDLHRNIQDAFNRAGVEIMSPHYAQLRDGNRTTVPAEHLPPGYEPPGFRVSVRRDGSGKTGEPPAAGG
ncbi:MAG: mechanosensitive ion channel family protein [Gemmatimonadota bacterium]